MKNVIIKHL